MHSDMCPIAIKTVVSWCKEKITIQEKQVDLVSRMVVFESILLSLLFEDDDRGRLVKNAAYEKGQIIEKVEEKRCW